MCTIIDNEICTVEMAHGKSPEIMLQLRLFRYKISGCRTYWPKLLYLLKVKNILALQITFNYRDH